MPDFFNRAIRLILSSWIILRSFNIGSVYVSGKLIALEGSTLIEQVSVEPINHFNVAVPSVDDLRVPAGEGKMRVIKAHNGQLVTSTLIAEPKIEDGLAVSDTSRDILKLVVLNRYTPQKPSVAFIKGFNLKNAALASTIAHDSHNIIAVGTDDNLIIRAIEKIINFTGGISIYTTDNNFSLSLPVAGLMSTKDGLSVAEEYKLINNTVREAGCDLDAPLMTLSFMSLLVIPELKLSDKGLFDGTTFSFVHLFDN